MLSLRATLTSTALALVFASQPAHADLTPADVWEDWRSYISGFGNSVTASETTDGNSLIISDLTVNVNMPEDEGSGTIQMGTLTFTGNGDGTVDISVAETMPITMQMDSEIDGDVDYTFDFVNSGFEMTASGTPTALEYAYTADSLGLVLSSFMLNGTVVPPEDGNFVMRMLNVVGDTQMALAGMRTYSQTVTADSIEFDLTAKSPEDGSVVAGKSALSGMRYSGQGAFPLDVVQTNDMSQMLAAGFAITGALTFGAGQSEFTTDGPGGAVSATTSSGGTNGSIDMSADGLAYALTQNAVTADLRTDAFPFPLSFSMQEALFKLTMPIQQSDEAQDFGLGLTLGGFEMSDALWGIFDPTSQLPRDPATVAVDMTGTGRLMFNVMDPSSTDLPANPAEVDSLDINTLQVSVAGADLTGTGAFTFQNPEPGGMPQPNGAIDLTLVGGNALLDKLVAIGLLPEDQAMGARMMMGLFAVPDGAPDTLTSKIEINEEGHIIANGQRIQ